MATDTIILDPAETGGKDATTEKKKNLDPRDNFWGKISISSVIIIACAVIITYELSYVLDSNILKSKIYWLGISAVATYGLTRWLYKKSDFEKIVISLLKISIGSVIVLLPFVTGIIGIKDTHYFAWKNEKIQKNEIVRLERERATGPVAEVTQDILVYSEKEKASIKINRGTTLPLVLEENKPIEKTDGPYRLIQVYLPHPKAKDQPGPAEKTLETKDEKGKNIKMQRYVFSEKSEKAWVRLGDVEIQEKFVQYNGFKKQISKDGKTITIIFETNKLVRVIDNLSVDQTYIITGAINGLLKAPSVHDSSKMVNVPLGYPLINKKAISLNLQYEDGGGVLQKIIQIKML